LPTAARALAQLAGAEGPEGPAVVELDRKRLDRPFLDAPGERIRGADALPVRVVEGEREAPPGSERWIRSPQASSRSFTADSLRCRSRSMCCSTTKPEAKANSSSTATTVA